MLRSDYSSLLGHIEILCSILGTQRKKDVNKYNAGARAYKDCLWQLGLFSLKSWLQGRLSTLMSRLLRQQS